MPTVNVTSIKYSVELVTETGKSYLINEALLSLKWEEQINELSQRASITLSNTKADDTWLMNLAKINCLIFIYAEWGENDQGQTFTGSIADRVNTISSNDYTEPGISKKKLVFSGIVWEWQYTSATQKEITLTAYDRMIQLQQSKDFKYIKAGMDTKTIISGICSDWGIPLNYSWNTIIHEKKTYSSNTISDMIFDLLEDVRKKTGQKYIAYFKDNQLVICQYGMNQDVYVFDFENTVSTTNKLTINNLVTRVKIIGKEDKSGRAPVEATINGDTGFGVLQEIVRHDSNKKLSDVQKEANTILKDRGKPVETITVEAPDLPFLRKGDMVQMGAGNLLGLFFVEGATHTAETRMMNMTLSRKYET